MRSLLFLALAALAAFAEGADTARIQRISVIVPVIAPPAVAALPAAVDTPPDVLLSTVTSELTAALKQDPSLPSSGQRVVDMVGSTILPLFDFRHMTQLAVARDWRLASADQQNALVTEFRTLLVRTYSAALASFRDGTIEYKSTRLAPGQTDATVRSTVKQAGAERLAIDYDMQKLASGWKVYDIKIAGISLITNYRSTFAHTIRDAGVDGLIKSLAQKNRQNEQGLRSDESSARSFLFMFAVVPSFSRDGR